MKLNICTWNLLNPEPTVSFMSWKGWIKTNNEYKLPFAEGFWNNSPLIYQNKVFSIQNIPNENNDDCLENQRKIIIFDTKWVSFN